ncbi:hypothetical protein [Kitasatospora aureofaciens]|uniref:hypothetical protein n=1 Tax=Kitasatospora aureofaciens TaxID=1894 RepID=UPI0037FD3D21
MSTPDEGRPAIAAWAETLTCYTAAAGSWLAYDRSNWWRPFAAGGPYLAIEPVGDRFRFHHHPRPLCHSLGLSLRTAPHWSGAADGILGELARSGRVVVAGDTFSLPWHPGFGRARAPHWFVLSGDPLVADDPLGLTGELGRQQPVRVPVPADGLAGLCAALPPGSPVYELRESAVLGTPDPQVGPAYRWLVQDGVVGAPELPPADRMGGADALTALAAHFAQHAGEPDAYEQADDLWQALRQREFVAKALAEERAAGVPVPDPDAWTEVLGLWRTLPPLLLHARLLARSGRVGRSATALPETLHRLAEAEARCAGERFPEELDTTGGLL